MNASAISEKLRLLLLALLVLISRLPFLSAGYGVEEDSWGIAVAAYHTNLYGVMEASRLPGHPVNELIYSIFWGNGPWLFNFFSAICSVVCFVLFYLIAKKLRVKNYAWAALALVFTPVVYINSTCTIDYLWALMFATAAFYAIIHQKLFWSAVLLALAVGCRINSTVLYLPFLIWLFYTNKNQYKLNDYIKFSFVFGLATLICFIPIIKVYGWNFFSYSDQFPYPSIPKVLYKASIGVIGLPAFLTTIFLVGVQIKKTKYNSIPPRLNYLFLSLFLLQMFSYLILPQKSAYLMLLVPFGILWFAYFLSPRHFVILCATLVFSSFFMSVNLTDSFRGAKHSKLALKMKISGQEIFFDPISGPVFNDYTKRLNKLDYTTQVLKKANEINYPTIVICGWWFNQILIEQMKKPQQGMVKFAFYLSPLMMENYILKGYQIYYLSEQEIYNDLFYRFNRTKNIASPFLFVNSK